MAARCQGMGHYAAPSHHPAALLPAVSHTTEENKLELTRDRGKQHVCF